MSFSQHLHPVSHLLRRMLSNSLMMPISLVLAAVIMLKNTLSGGLKDIPTYATTCNAFATSIHTSNLSIYYCHK